MTLIIRIITALVLVGIMAGILYFLPRWGFVFFVEIFLLIALFEWCRMCQIDEFQQAISFALFIVLTLPFIMNFMGFPLLSVRGTQRLEFFLLNVSMLFWLIAVPWILHKKFHVNKGWTSAFLGAWMIAVTVIAVANLLNRSNLALIAGLSIPIIADTFAFIGGKLIGQTSLTIISPKKTKEGLAIGMLAVILIGGFILQQSFSWPHLLGYPIALLCGIAAVYGDLLESLAKRWANVKDSGGLLPGHGGVLDRFDSHFAALVVLTACLTWA